MENKSENANKPWLDPKGNIYSDAALREISKSWTAEMWETFLHETIDCASSEDLITPKKYDFLCEELSESIWNSDTPEHLPEFKAEVRNAVKQLTLQQQQIIKAVFWNDRSFREIAKSIGTSHQLVAIQKTNSLKKLKKILNRHIAAPRMYERDGSFSPPENQTIEEQIREVYLQDLNGSYFK